MRREIDCGLLSSDRWVAHNGYAAPEVDESARRALRT